MAPPIYALVPLLPERNPGRRAEPAYIEKISSCSLVIRPQELSRFYIIIVAYLSSMRGDTVPASVTL